MNPNTFKKVEDSNMKNILAIGAHYDDVELGVGGTLAKLKQNGANVYKLTLTDNETNFKEMNIHVDADSSAICSQKACKVLGISEITDFEPVKCNNLCYSPSLMQRIESIIFEKKIDTVFIHFKDDINKDHIAAYELCVTAARYCDNILMFSSNGYLPYEQFSPTVFFDISDYIELKKKALAAYDGDHNRFNSLFETIIKRNEVYGFACQTKYAEGFVPIKFKF